MELIPAILAKDEAALHERLVRVKDLTPIVHLDVMDGAFVPNRTWFDVAALRELNGAVAFELHLMVKDPSRYIEETRALEKVVRVIWHIETDAHHAALITHCHELSKEAGLAINPHTPVDALAPYSADLDEILIMGAEPGFSGRKLDPAMIGRARELHTRWPHVPLGFDIGVNEETIPLLKNAGVTRFCAASAIFEAENPIEALHKLQALI